MCARFRIIPHSVAGASLRVVRQVGHADAQMPVGAQVLRRGAVQGKAG